MSWVQVKRARWHRVRGLSSRQGCTCSGLRARAAEPILKRKAVLNSVRYSYNMPVQREIDRARACAVGKA